MLFIDFSSAFNIISNLTIKGATVERVSSTKFLGVHITEDLSWTNNSVALAKKARSVSTSSANSEEPEPRPPIMCTFYRGIIESILSLQHVLPQDPSTDSESSLRR